MLLKQHNSAPTDTTPGKNKCLASIMRAHAPDKIALTPTYMPGKGFFKSVFGAKFRPLSQCKNSHYFPRIWSNIPNLELKKNLFIVNIKQPIYQLFH